MECYPHLLPYYHCPRCGGPVEIIYAEQPGEDVLVLCKQPHCTANAHADPFDCLLWLRWNPDSDGAPCEMMG